MGLPPLETDHLPPHASLCGPLALSILVSVWPFATLTPPVSSICLSYLLKFLASSTSPSQTRAEFYLECETAKAVVIYAFYIVGKAHCDRLSGVPDAWPLPSPLFVILQLVNENIKKGLRGLTWFKFVRGLSLIPRTVMMGWFPGSMMSCVGRVAAERSCTQTHMGQGADQRSWWVVDLRCDLRYLQTRCWAWRKTAARSTVLTEIVKVLLKISIYRKYNGLHPQLGGEKSTSHSGDTGGEGENRWDVLPAFLVTNVSGETVFNYIVGGGDDRLWLTATSWSIHLPCGGNSIYSIIQRW